MKLKLTIAAIVVMTCAVAVSASRFSDDAGKPGDTKSDAPAGSAPAAPLAPDAPPAPDANAGASWITSQLSDRLPSWLTINGELRGRGESFTGVGLVTGHDDQDFATRVRLGVGITFTPWFRVYGQAQDSRAFNYFTRPVPNNVANSADIRQAYGELGGGSYAWRVRAGRQELAFGEERLVGVADWNNVTKYFDAVRATYTTKNYSVDAFASSLVVTLDGLMDHHQDGVNLHGIYGTFRNWIPNATVDTYVFMRTNPLVAAEVGPKGHLGEFTYGTRIAGKLFRHFDYGTEMAIQRGHSSGDSVAAWAGHWVAGYTFHESARPVRVFGQFNYASGDNSSTDGHKGTFDQLYPSNHNKYGLEDLFGWRNIQDAMAGAEWKVSNRWKVSSSFHSYWLANVNDSLYNSSGSSIAKNTKATSTFVGREADVFAAYALTKQVQLGAGFSRLFAGDYLIASKLAAHATSTYLMWNYKF